jgi:hypothetical protein
MNMDQLYFFIGGLFAGALLISGAVMLLHKSGLGNQILFGEPEPEPEPKESRKDTSWLPDGSTMRINGKTFMFAWGKVFVDGHPWGPLGDEPEPLPEPPDRDIQIESEGPVAIHLGDVPGSLTYTQR